jgi:hypothetical protein
VPGRITDELRRATREYGERHPVASSEDDPPTAAPEQRTSLRMLSIALLVGLMIGGWFLFRQLQANSKLQDCVMSGRRNCAPIDTAPSNP